MTSPTIRRAPTKGSDPPRAARRIADHRASWRATRRPFGPPSWCQLALRAARTDRARRPATSRPFTVTPRLSRHIMPEPTTARHEAALQGIGTTDCCAEGVRSGPTSGFELRWLAAPTPASSYGPLLRGAFAAARFTPRGWGLSLAGQTRPRHRPRPGAQVRPGRCPCPLSSPVRDATVPGVRRPPRGRSPASLSPPADGGRSPLAPLLYRIA